MTEDDIRMKIQALSDNELPESEIDAVLTAIAGSYEYRQEYADLLRLRRRLSPGPVPRVSDDWLAAAERGVARRVGRSTGTFLFVGSYLTLLVYGIVSLFGDPGVPLAVAVLVAGGVLGLGVLLVSAIADRVRESRHDKYREVLR